ARERRTVADRAQRALDDLRAILRAADVVLQQLQVAGDHRQQVVEVVRDAAGELADRLDPLRVAQLLLAAAALQRRAEQVRDRMQELLPVPIEGVRLRREGKQPAGRARAVEQGGGCRVAEGGL